MKIASQDLDELTVLSLRGEMTVDEVDSLRRAVVERLDAHGRDFVLDLSQIQIIDSKGLETLIWLQDQCLERLGQIRLAGCQDTIQTILRLTRLDARFELCDTVDLAVESLKP